MSWRGNLRYLAGAAAIAAAAAYAFWPRPVPVDLAAVGRGELLETIDGEGRTRVREIYTVSAPVGGRILRIEQHVGDSVRANETVLANIEPSAPTFLDRRARAQAEFAVKAAEAALSLAEAERIRAAADLDFVRSEFNRAEQLARRGNIAARDLDRARLDLRTREAALATAEATIAMRQYEVETARAALIQPGAGATADTASCCVAVYSPVDGRVLRLIHESEGVVGAGEALVEIGDPADLEVVADLLSSDAVRVTVGAAVEIADWGGTARLSGIVRRIEPFGFAKVSALGIEEQRVNVLIDRAGPPEAWAALGHGYRVEARIVVWRGTGVLKLPFGALFRDQERWAVFVAGDGVARLRPVEIGHGNGREAQVLSGLEEGEIVILHPGDRISDGVRIEARTPG